MNAGGTLAPGNSPGLMTIGSGSVFHGTVALQIGGLSRGVDYDAINIGGVGEITFGGTLALSLFNGFAPAPGESFELFNFRIGGGRFDALDLPPLSAGLTWDASGLYSNGTLTVAGTAIPEPCSFALALGLCALAAWVVARHRSCSRIQSCRQAQEP